MKRIRLLTICGLLVATQGFCATMDGKRMRSIGSGPVPHLTAAGMCTGFYARKDDSALEVLSVQFYPPVSASSVGSVAKLPNVSGKVYPIKVDARWVITNPYTHQKTYVDMLRDGFVVKDQAFNEWKCSSRQRGRL